MIPFALILLSTLVGILGGPFWIAMVCGVLLAVQATAERPIPSGSTMVFGQMAILSTGVISSVLLGLAASVGSFSVGLLLSGLIWA